MAGGHLAKARLDLSIFILGNNMASEGRLQSFVKILGNVVGEAAPGAGGGVSLFGDVSR